MRRPEVGHPAAGTVPGAPDLPERDRHPATGDPLELPSVDEESTRLVNHWVDLSEWQGGRQLWAFYLTFGLHPELHAYVHRQQALLADLPGLDLVQPSWLHLTVQGIAFADALDADSLSSLTEAGTAVAQSWTPLELVVGTAVAEDDSVTMPVWVSGGMAGLRDDLRSVARSALHGSEPYALPEPAGGFSPHITIAYARSDSPTVREVASRLAHFDEPPLQLEVAALSLVRLNRGTSRWWWTEEHPLRLLSSSARR